MSYSTDSVAVSVSLERHSGDLDSTDVINTTDASKPFHFDRLSEHTSVQKVAFRHSEVGPVPGGNISERQRDWDMQARTADEKQAELFHTQWNLIREQMSTFSKELISIRTELKCMKEEVNACFEQEDLARESGDEQLRIKYEQLSGCLDKEVQQRTTQFSEVEKIISGLRAGQEGLRVNIEDITSQQGLLERSLTNINDDLRQMETRLRVDIEAEPRAREEACERLRVELQQATASTSRSIDAITLKLETTLKELHEAIRRENEERARHIQERAEETIRISREYKLAIEKESHDWRASDDVLRAQVQNISGALEKERNERDSLFASFRTQFSDFKQELSSQNSERGIRELRTMIEDEAKKRADGDGAGSAALSRLQSQLETEIRERARILPDVTEKLKLLSEAIDAEASKRATRVSELDSALRILIEQESKTRAADRVHSDEELHRLKAELDVEVRARQDAISRASLELHEAMKPLTDAINREIQERQRQDEEAVHLALQAKQACEKEAQERAADYTKAMEVLKDLGKSLEQEKVDRDRFDGNLRSQITETRQELETEKGERRDEAAALGRAVRSVETVVTTGLKDLRGALDSETGERKEENKTVMLNMSRVQTQIDVESKELARVHAEMSDRLRALSDALGLEATERKDANSEIERAYRDLSAACEQEARQRAQAFQAVQDAMKAEISERRAGDEAGDKNLRVAMTRTEKSMEHLRDVLWAKMVSLTDRFLAFGREWRDTPPSVDIVAQTTVLGSLSLRDDRSSLRAVTYSA